jgi:hypothetical protein
LALIFGSLGLTACAGPSGAVTPASPAGNSSAAGEVGNARVSPVPPPRASITGCVESRELKAHVLALEAHRTKARRAALAALGASDEPRAGRFGAPDELARVGSTFEANGKRWAVAAHLAGPFEPRTTLAKQIVPEGALLRPIAERPRAHPVGVVSCGVQRCASKPAEPCPPAPGTPAAPCRPRATSPARPLMIELGPNETWGAPLELAYDYWWANVSYEEVEPCTAGAASATP